MSTIACWTRVIVFAESISDHTEEAEQDPGSTFQKIWRRPGWKPAGARDVVRHGEGRCDSRRPPLTDSRRTGATAALPACLSFWAGLVCVLLLGQNKLQAAEPTKAHRPTLLSGPHIGRATDPLLPPLAFLSPPNHASFG